MKKIRGWILLPLCFFFLLSACSSQRENTAENQYKVYYVNHEETAVLSETCQIQSTEPEAVIEELLERLGTVPDRLEYRAPLAGSFSLLDMTLSEGQLVLNFDEAYKSQEIISEILTRAAIVRTLIQVKEVQMVSFTVASSPLEDASGNVIGTMNQDTFVDNAGNEINTYERVRLRLYLANAKGDALTAVSRSVVYSSNFSPERMIVEELIAGPKEYDTGLSKSHNAYPVMNPETKIISVNIRDGICYVNLDESFLNQVYNVSPEVTVYSVTNSLVELSNVNKVQISINGETNVSYRESISLSTVFERNLDLVEQ